MLLHLQCTDDHRLSVVVPVKRGRERGGGVEYLSCDWVEGCHSLLEQRANVNLWNCGEHRVDLYYGRLNVQGRCEGCLLRVRHPTELCPWGGRPGYRRRHQFLNDCKA